MPDLAINGTLVQSAACPNSPIRHYCTSSPPTPTKDFIFMSLNPFVHDLSTCDVHVCQWLSPVQDEDQLSLRLGRPWSSDPFHRYGGSPAIPASRHIVRHGKQGNTQKGIDTTIKNARTCTCMMPLESHHRGYPLT